jgi:hypothetical protein
MAYYYKLQELIAYDIPYIPLWYPNNIAVGSSSIKDFQLQTSGEWINLLFARKERHVP